MQRLKQIVDVWKTYYWRYDKKCVSNNFFDRYEKKWHVVWHKSLWYQMRRYKCFLKTLDFEVRYFTVTWACYPNPDLRTTCIVGVARGTSAITSGSGGAHPADSFQGLPDTFVNLCLITFLVTRASRRAWNPKWVGRGVGFATRLPDKFDDSDPSDSDPRPICYKKETYFAK